MDQEKSKTEFPWTQKTKIHELGNNKILLYTSRKAKNADSRVTKTVWGTLAKDRD